MKISTILKSFRSTSTRKRKSYYKRKTNRPYRKKFSLWNWLNKLGIVLLIVYILTLKG